MSRFNGYYANIPPFLKTEHVKDYHSHVAAFEEASGEDLSHFKIPPDRLKPKVISVRPGWRLRGWFRERSIFIGEILRLELLSESDRWAEKLSLYYRAASFQTKL